MTQAANSYGAKPLADQISDYLRANMLDGCAEGQLTMHSKVFLEEVSSLVADFIEERHDGPKGEDRDAARYRWLREAYDTDWNKLLRDGGEQMDANIDELMRHDATGGKA